MRILFKNQNQVNSRTQEKNRSLEMLYACLNSTKAQAEVLKGYKQGKANAALELGGPKGFWEQLPVCYMP